MIEYIKAFFDFFVDMLAAIRAYIGDDSASGGFEYLEDLFKGFSN